MTRETAIVFDVARCSIHDGPGLRTTVFLKGCPMDCLWCHNPESKATRPETSTNPNTGETRVVGAEMTVAEVMKVVARDKDYYDGSGGGLTISGGEPLMRPGFVAALAKAAKAQGIHVAIETSGMVAWRHFEAVLPYVDLYLFDYKDSDPQRLARNTKGESRLIEGNFQRLHDLGKSITRRCLLVPGINDTPAHIETICTMSMRYRRKGYRMEFMFYHDLGASKAANIGTPYRLKGVPNMDTPEAARRIKAMVAANPHENIFLGNARI